MHSPETAEQLDARRRLAFDANAQLAKMAEGIVRLLELEADDNTTLYCGMLQRIQQLNSIMFHAMRLHGDPAGEWGPSDAIATLRRDFQGPL